MAREASFLSRVRGIWASRLPLTIDECPHRVCCFDWRPLALVPCGNISGAGEIRTSRQHHAAATSPVLLCAWLAPPPFPDARTDQCVLARRALPVLLASWRQVSTARLHQHAPARTSGVRASPVFPGRSRARPSASSRARAYRLSCGGRLPPRDAVNRPGRWHQMVHTPNPVAAGVQDCTPWESTAGVTSRAVCPRGGRNQHLVGRGVKRAPPHRLLKKLLDSEPVFYSCVRSVEIAKMVA
ncbi:hypothetical protein BU14_0057s0028 [Porphyra umbilicalis]|uniref:Uncharacterized protein n=1 Tax=Porphyra umbilicalis TaxID=2786 RepID=A0A1X6PH67_PORUM|nr:hypothetical protein BU14_0057s0028 [Porphyra umbilicalis]|eukprot:OSX80207.1 hypothetical protein BU14_0057s0028 [Porphyra umbilicalis]